MTAPSTPPTSPPDDGRDGSAAPKTPTLMFSWMEDPDAALEMPWTKDVRRWLAEHLNRTLPHAQAKQPAEAETQQPAEAQTQQTLPPSAAPPTRT